MYTLIFFSPLFIFFTVFFLGARLGGFYTALAVAFSTFFSCLLCFDALSTFFYHSFNFSYYLPFFSLFEVAWFSVNWHFFLDTLVIFMFSLICLVSFFIQVFSISYMGEDASHVRFMIYLCFFMIAMILLVGAANFLQLFFGWELVGLASYLLINFWYARQDANAAAFKAMAVNRVGDCFLLAGMLLFAFQYNSLDFDFIFCMASPASAVCGLAFLFLLIGAFAKSAQFIFHTWLPDAMEGPTPVSALLHSATMVTAGVFLTMRFIDLLEIFPLIRYLVVFLGLLTAFYAMAIAAVADDTKRVTAYTTLNQLGFMFYGCGSLAFSTVLFHLIVHGFYKSFSFLTAAAELHDFEDEQDGESDQLDVSNSNSVYDLLNGLVFFSINAIPFTSPSISKEFMLLSGLEKMPDYFTYMVGLVLFSSFIDEGRDDVESDYSDSSFYGDDLHVHSGLPFFITFGCFGLGLFSLISASFLEEIFLDLTWYTSPSAFAWIDIRGTILLILPFLAVLFAEFDSSSVKLSGVADISKNSVLSRADGRYLSVLFNSELWFYDELISKLNYYFYKFFYFQTNNVLDKGFLELFYVSYPSTFIFSTSFFDVLFKTTVEKYFFFAQFLSVSFFCFLSVFSATFMFFNAGWFLLCILVFYDLLVTSPRSADITKQTISSASINAAFGQGATTFSVSGKKT